MKSKSISLLIPFTWLLAGSTPAISQVKPDAPPSAAPGLHFSYSGDDGPGFWHDRYPACAETGTSHQSPVDLGSAIENSDLKPLHVSFYGTSFILSDPEPGFTVQATPVDMENNPNILLIDGTVFRLLQFHFHTLSEHTLLGAHTGMELHAVFRDEGLHYAVIGVFYRIGEESHFLKRLIEAHLPEKTSSPQTEIRDLNLEHSITDVASYYTYEGSLTTPPCSEGLRWYVLKDEKQMSPEQFEAFRKVLGDDFRPTQKLNDRTVYATPRQ